MTKFKRPKLKRSSGTKTKMNLKRKLNLILFLVSILPLIVLGLASYRTAHNVLYNKLKVTSLQNIKQVQSSIDFSFEKYESILNLFSELDIFKDVYYDSSLGEEAFETLGYAQKDNPSILGAYIGLKNKETILYPKTELEPGYDPRERDWYKAAMANKGELVYSDPYIDAFTGKDIITVSKTVEDKGGTIGALAIDIALEDLTNTLSNIEVGTNGYLHIIDSRGITVAHPDSEELRQESAKEMIWWKDVSTEEENFDTYKDGSKTEYIGFTTDSKRHWKVVVNLDKKELSQDTNKLGIIIGSMLLAIIILTLIISFNSVKWINKNISQLIGGFQRASSGDLLANVDINTGDEFEELGKEFNSMVGTIRNLVNDVNESSNIILSSSEATSVSANQVFIAIDEVSITVDELAQGAVSQAEDINTSVEGINKLAEEIEVIEELSNNMNNISKETNHLSQNGLEEMNNLTEKTEEANKSSKDMAGAIKDMNEVTNEIGMITDTINGISAQTNLLALNAAIEAARAGEAGKGFSVVADEIRKLAEQSSEATDQIQELIEKIKGKSNVAVKSMDNTEAVVKEQTRVVEETTITFGKIMDSISSLMKGIDDIKFSVEKANSTKEDIVNRMLNISSVAEESSASTEEVSASTEEVNATMEEFNQTALELKQLSQELKDKLSIFKI